MGAPREQGEGVLFYIGEIKNLAFFQTRKVSKTLKNQRKFYNFLKILKENLRYLKILKEALRIFENSLRFYRNFRENVWKNFGNMDF